MSHSEEWYSKWKPPRFIRKKGCLYETEWGWAVSHPENLRLGWGVDVGYGTYINAEAGVEIEDRVQIGGHCGIYSVSSINGKKGKVTLKRKCKIGSYTLIMPGVTVGEEAVCGAYSYVDKDVEAHTILIPQKKVKRQSLL